MWDPDSITPAPFFLPKQCPRCKHMFGINGLESKHLFCRARNYYGLRFRTFENGTLIYGDDICFDEEPNNGE